MLRFSERKQIVRLYCKTYEHLGCCGRSDSAVDPKIHRGLGGRAFSLFLSSVQRNRHYQSIIVADVVAIVNQNFMQRNFVPENNRKGYTRWFRGKKPHNPAGRMLKLATIFFSCHQLFLQAC